MAEVALGELVPESACSLFFTSLRRLWNIWLSISARLSLTFSPSPPVFTPGSRLDLVGIDRSSSILDRAFVISPSTHRSPSRVEES
ncbi:hypothetical protein VTN49DRAFT_5094 [Thermomyces lanuginosus]|uniref:uncharacterized protein n=1 Tax=Thermomyces lanuginosus TaxID=5541 RepID=UPI003742DFA0